MSLNFHFARAGTAPASHVANRLLALSACALTMVAQSAASAQSPSRLQSLVNDTAVQFQIAYRQNAPEHRTRYAQLSRAVAEWKTAPRSEENNRLLADWLRSAIRRSMPGSRESLPPRPNFERPLAEAQPSAPPAEKLIGDPFADDPIEIDESAQ
jgi:hypothetical protein